MSDATIEALAEHCCYNKQAIRVFLLHVVPVVLRALVVLCLLLLGGKCVQIFMYF